MLMQKYTTTHKIHKITTRTITDSYKQLFVLITVLLTILSLQPTTILTMAAPLEPQHNYQQHFLHTYHQQQQQLQPQQPQPSQLHEIMLAERHRYDHDNYINHHYRHHQKQQQQQQSQQHHQRQLQIETDLNRNLKKSKANIIRYERSDDDEDRLRKREISWHEYYQRIMQSQAINWYNPCGGISLRNETPVKRKRPPPIKKVSLQIIIKN